VSDRRADYRWRVLVAAYLAAFYSGLIFQSCPPVIPLITKTFMVSHGEGGLLMTAVGLPILLLSIPVGILVDRYRIRILGGISVALMVFGSLIVAVSSSFLLAIIGRLISGVGVAIITIVAPKFLPMWFPQEERGLVMGIYATTMPAAVLVAFWVLGILGVTYSWRAPFYIGAGIGIVVLAIFFGLIREKMLAPSRLSLSTILGNSTIWMLGLSWLLFNAAALSFMTWAPDFLIEVKGFDLTEAGLASGSFMLIAVIVSPIGGWISDKFGRRKAFVIVGSLALAAALPLLPALDANLVWLTIIIMGAFAAIVAGPTFALSSEILGFENTGVAFGIIYTCFGIGLAVAPPLVGYLRDFYGSYTLPFYVMALFALVAAAPASIAKTE